MSDIVDSTTTETEEKPADIVAASLRGQLFVGQMFDMGGLMGCINRICNQCTYCNDGDGGLTDCQCGLAKDDFKVAGVGAMPKIIDDQKVGYFCRHWLPFYVD